MKQDSLIHDSLAHNDLTVNAEAPPLVSMENIGVHIELTQAPESVLVGDTFDLVVAVSWEAQEGALLLLPGNSVNVKGLEQISVRQESGRSVKDGRQFSENHFVYSIVATDTGHFTIPAIKILSPISQGNSLELKTAPVSIRVDEPYHFLPLAFASIALILFAFVAFWRVHRRRTQEKVKVEQNVLEKEWRNAFLLLKQRVHAANSRDWLLALEKECLVWIKRHLGESAMELRVKNGDFPEWKPLMDEFAHARYGGGSRDSFMNLETWKIAAKLMNIKEED